MSLTTSHVHLDAPRERALVDVLEQLPAALWVDGVVQADLWDRALLDPARDILSRNGKGVRGRLVEHGWVLAGGMPGTLPDALSITLELLHVGSLVVDDIQDDSSMRRGEPAVHRRYGMPVALNMANWLYFIAVGLVSRTELEPVRRLALLQDVNEGLLRCHQGQALDLSVRVSTVARTSVADVVSTSTSLKTGSLMGLATTMGARAAGASGERLASIQAFGVELGIALQMLDDWSSVAVPRRREKGAEDLIFQRPTWPWAWAAELGTGFDELVRALEEAESARDLDAVASALVDALRDRAPAHIDRHFERVVTRLGTIEAEESARAAAMAEVTALRSAFS